MEPLQHRALSHRGPAIEESRLTLKECEKVDIAIVPGVHLRLALNERMPHVVGSHAIVHFGD